MSTQRDALIHDWNQPDWKAPFRGPLAEPGSDDLNGTT